jgi:predicted Ser/Thr protein kinase
MASRYPEGLVDELERLTRERERNSAQELPSVTDARQTRIDEIVSQLKAVPAAKKGDVACGVTLVRIIGKGNFGVVWQAVDETSGKFFAVKMFDSDRLGLGLSLYHFRRGVRAMLHLLASPSRPDSVIRVHKTEDAGLTFSMDYVDGRDLINISRRGWSLAKKLEVFGEVCGAVDFAHEHGVLHRDIKPANIVMTSDGHPVLTDFDIADLLFIKTLSTQASGTVSYSAPEQLSGHSRKDATGDVYSMGRLLHFLLIEGDPDFIFEKVPSLENLDSHPEGLVRIVRKCTMRDPDDRYSSIAELVGDLHEYDSKAGIVGAGAIPLDPDLAEAGLYRILFSSGLGHLLDLWGLHPTPGQVLSNETLDELCGGRIEVEKGEGYHPFSITYGGPPYGLGTSSYADFSEKYKVARERLKAYLGAGKPSSGNRHTGPSNGRGEPGEEDRASPGESADVQAGATAPWALPLRVLREAIRAVPAVKYALGVAGIVSAIAIIVSFGIDLRVAFFGAVLMFVLMTMLVVFARLSGAVPKYLTLPAIILVYFSVILTIGTATLLFTSVFFQRPIDLKHWVTGSPTVEGHDESRD